MAKLIGTAGHVDHGKTSLIHALTGIDADRLPEERERGMTIEIGFAYLDFPKLGRVSIVDVPGHEKLVHNMLVGAVGMDVALLCVAADDGVRQQTREHFHILELLPVQRMVIALTRSDLADLDLRSATEQALVELLAGTRFEGSPLIAVSAVTGEGIDALRSVLEAELALCDALPSMDSWSLPIDRVFSLKGHGCVVTGTLAQGKVKVGDLAKIEPGSIEARVRSIHSHDQPLEVGEPGRRIALNLAGPKVEELWRGQMIGTPGSVFATKMLDAEVQWGELPKHASRVRVSIGAEEAIGKVFLSNDSSNIAQLRLEKEIACVREQPLIIRRYSPPDLLGGGRVKVPQAVPRRKSEKPGSLGEGTLEEQILAFLAQHPLGAKTEDICRVLARSPQSLGSVFEDLAASGRALGFGGLWFGKDDWANAGELFVGSLNELHSKNPLKAYLPRESVVAAAQFPWSGKPLDRMMSALAADSKIALSGTLVKSGGFRVSLNAKQRAFLDRVKEGLDLGHVNPASPRDLAKTLHVPPQAMEEILRLGVESGELIRVFDEIFYTKEGVERIKVEMREKFQGRFFTAAEFRDAFGSSRRYAIPLLEYLDSAGFSLRTADKRVIR